MHSHCHNTLNAIIYLHKAVDHGRRHRGGWRDGSPPPRFEVPGDVPPEITFFKENFMHICQNLQIFQYFQNKVVEIRGAIGIWG